MYHTVKPVVGFHARAGPREAVEPHVVPLVNSSGVSSRRASLPGVTLPQQSRQAGATSCPPTSDSLEGGQFHPAPTERRLGQLGFQSRHHPAHPHAGQPSTDLPAELPSRQARQHKSASCRLTIM
jgi:hypothetical protein